jgi:hypothetical protein
MAKYTGGMQVAGGYYWNPRSWSVEVIPEQGGKLPGVASAGFVKIPFLALFVVVPLMGAGFLMSLPLIGFAVFGRAVLAKAASGAKRSAAELASTVAPGGFAAGEAHLTGKEGAPEGTEAQATAELERIEKELAERKNQK